MANEIPLNNARNGFLAQNNVRVDWQPVNLCMFFFAKATPLNPSFSTLIHSFLNIPHFTSPSCWSIPRNRRAIVEEVPEVEEDEVDINDVAEEEEMDFSITRRPAVTVTKNTMVFKHAPHKTHIPHTLF